MSTTSQPHRPATTYTLAGRTVNRMGYGAMQLAGPRVRPAEGS